MAKEIIRLTESDLHKLIKESVQKIISERHQNLENEYADEAENLYGVFGGFPKIPKTGNKQDEIDYSWKLSNDVDDLKQTDLDNKEGMDEFFKQYDHNPEEERTDWVQGYENYGAPSATDRIKTILDKQWQDTKDMEKINKQADSRPLHRKGALNRA